MSFIVGMGRAAVLAAALTLGSPLLSACKGGAAAEEQLISALEPLVIDTSRGPVTFQVEVADDEMERQNGLMFRKSLAPDRGMLFEFPDTAPRSFWMKNTYIPLDIIYIDPEGYIVSIAAMTTPHSEEGIPSRGLAKGVLEIAGGRAGELGIKPGDRIRHPFFGNE